MTMYAATAAAHHAHELSGRVVTASGASSTGKTDYEHDESTPPCGSFDVIIVGAGLSGLTAAYTILQKKGNASVLIIEAADRIGGDVYWEELRSASGTNCWDVSVIRIGSSQKEILALLADLGLETEPCYNKGNKVWRLPDGKLKKFSGPIPPLPYLTLADLLRYFKKVDGMRAKINLDQVQECKHAEEWNDLTVKDFIDKVLWTQVGKICINTMVSSFCNARSSELSVMQYLYLIQTCGSWDLHINSGDKGRSDLCIKERAMTLCKKLCAQIGEEKIVLGDAVTSITEQECGENAKVKVTTASGKEYCAQRVIVALPCHSSGNIIFDPPLKINRSKTFSRKCDMLASVMTYKSPFWREAGLTGEYMNMAATSTTTQDATDETIIFTVDTTLPGGDAALKVFSNPARLKGKSKEERKQAICGYLKDVFGPQIVDCIDYTDREFLHQSGSDEDTASRPSELLALLTKPHGCVHWAGADSGSAWCGLLNGAVHAGQRAAKEIIAGIQAW